MEISNPARPLPAAGIDHANLFRLDGNSYVILGAGSGLGEHVSRTIVGLGGRVLVRGHQHRAPAVAGRRTGHAVPGRRCHQRGRRRRHRRGGRRGIRADQRVRRCDRADAPQPDLRVLAWTPGNGTSGRTSAMLSWPHGRWRPWFPTGRLRTSPAPWPRAAVCWRRATARPRPRWKSGSSRWLRSTGPAASGSTRWPPDMFLSPRVAAKERSSQDERALSSRSMLGRLGQPFEIAAALVFLLSPAAGYITGTTIPVEGGALSRDSTGLDEL